MASVAFKRTNNINSVPITDGQLIFDTSDQKIYLDNGNTREVYGGGSGTDLISNVSDATDNNAFNANATVNLFTRKSSIVDTKAEIQSVTQAGVPLGCKGFNEVIGTGDISELGDGSVTGAILANKSAIDTVNQNLTKLNTTTKTIWANVNGVWTDLHIRAWYDSIQVWNNGEFGISVDNGVYHPNSSESTINAFAIDGNLLVRQMSLPANRQCTLVSHDTIDFSGYSKVTLVNNKMQDIVLNVSGVNTEGYLWVTAWIDSSNLPHLAVGVSSTKENFSVNLINNTATNGYGSQAVTSTFGMTAILIE